MSANIRIALRQSPEWSSLDGDAEVRSFEAQILGAAQGSFAELVALWDRVFAVRFFEVRARLKALSLENFAAAGTLIGVAEALENPRRDVFYLFTDDDDWYAPHVAQALATYDPQAVPGVVWGSARIGARFWAAPEGSGSPAPFEGGLQLRARNGHPYTNNYAIGGRFLREHPQLAAATAQHFDLLALVGAGRIALASCESYLSVTHKHAASASVLSNGLGAARDRQGLVRLVAALRASYDEVALPAELAWAEALLREVRALFDAVLDSARARPS